MFVPERDLLCIFDAGLSAASRLYCRPVGRLEGAPPMPFVEPTLDVFAVGIFAFGIDDIQYRQRQEVKVNQ